MTNAPTLARSATGQRRLRDDTATFTVTSADQDTLFQLGIKTVVDRSSRLRWTGGTNDFNQTLAHCRRTHPDILLLDERLDSNGALIRAATSSSAITTTIVLVTPDNLTPDRVDRLTGYGAQCLLDRTIPPADLANRIVQHHRGSVSLQVLPATRRSTSDQLTYRETQILGDVSIGLTNEEIAAQQTISPETVRTHIRKILRKLGARNRTHAVALAHIQDILPPPQNPHRRNPSPRSHG